MYDADAAVGSLAGAFIAARVGAGRLRTTFAYVVLLMAGYVVWRQAGPVAAAAILAIAAVVIAGLRWSGMAGRANPVKGRSLPLAAGSAMGSGGTTNDETFGSP